MMQKSAWVYLFLFYLLYQPAMAQDGGKDDNLTINSENMAPLTVELEDNDPDVELKKKKRKKNVFYGMKTKKGYVKTGFGNNQVIELFNYLRDFDAPDPYVRDIYWYDFKKDQLKKSSGVTPETGWILHGPYKKMLDDQVIEEGIFFMGTKHGRWTTFSRNDILMNKEKYYKGWPKESLVSYHDNGRKKLKEVIPIEFGEKEGNYFYFHDNGEMAISGEFHHGEKVNVWREYYKYRRKKKREIQYKKSAFEKNFQPYIIKEWDENGELIYDKEAAERAWN